MHAQIFVKKIRRKMTRTMEAMRCTCRKNDRVGKIRRNMWTLSKAIRKKAKMINPWRRVWQRGVLRII